MYFLDLYIVELDTLYSLENKTTIIDIAKASEYDASTDFQGAEQ